MSFLIHNGDSVRGQGCAAPRPARLVLEAVQNRPHPRTGALSADLRLKHLSAQGASLSTTATRKFCENVATGAQHVVARQRVNEVPA